jgi:hypothetical protein
MNRPSDSIIETSKVREVAGMFRSCDSLQAAVDVLLLSGFDRSVLDLVGGVAQLRGALSKASISLEELASSRGVARGTPFTPEDIILVQAMVVGILGFLAAAGAAAIVMISGGDTLQAVIAAALSGCLGGAFSGYVFARHFKLKDVIILDDKLADDGVMLWVRVSSPDQEAKAKQILLAHGAEDIRIFEAEVVKTTEDIPWSRLRPDPFIPVRLGDR